PTAEPATAAIVDAPPLETAPATETAGGIATGPTSGMQLAYAEASHPPYPPAALRAGYQGTVVLKVLVDIDGRPLRVEVDTGSGYRELDDAARRHVLRRWRFQPAMHDGQPARAIGLVPITFSLDRN
ncbi:MAG TPA: energy transducer TonB, partial [Luteimonas sp.]